MQWLLRAIRLVLLSRRGEYILPLRRKTPRSWLKTRPPADQHESEQREDAQAEKRTEGRMMAATLKVPNFVLLVTVFCCEYEHDPTNVEATRPPLTLAFSLPDRYSDPFSRE